jgi:hypothetical protein
MNSPLGIHSSVLVDGHVKPPHEERGMRPGGWVDENFIKNVQVKDHPGPQVGARPLTPLLSDDV